jgi:hypothetical protein
MKKTTLGTAEKVRAAGSSIPLGAPKALRKVRRHYEVLCR